MLKSLPSPVKGIIALLLVLLNSVFIPLIVFILGFLKLIIFHAGIRRQITRLCDWVALIWVDINSFIFLITQKTEVDVEGLDHPLPWGSYLVISNHRCMVDIFVLQHVFRRRIPFLKFFMKKVLIWLPFIGTACWALEMPFVKRYSKKYLEKHPERRGKDLETTRKHCERYKETPVSIMNFLEGTRFTREKREKHDSPYRHLLVTKTGGIALVFSTMGEYLAKVLDVTIVYPGNELPVRFWDLFAGHIPRLTIRVNVLPVPEKLVGRNYGEDETFREEIRHWVNGLWEEKDRRIEEIMQAYVASTAEREGATGSS